MFKTERKALDAEAEAVAEYIKSGRISTIPPTGSNDSETVFELYQRWVGWLRLHRSSGHAENMASLLARACAVAPELAAKAVDMLTEADVEAWGEAWAEDLLERDRGLKTINDWLRYSQTAFSPPWSRRRAKRELTNNPFKFIDRYSVVRQAKFVPSKASVDLIRMAAEGEFRLWLELALETAARPSEALVLSWEHVGPEAVTLFTRKTADGSLLPRRLAISEDLVGRLLSWRRRQPEGALYVFQQEQQEQAKPRVLTWVRKQLRAACERAGVDWFPPSSLRHYRASLWAAEGVPLTTIQARLGHTQATTTNNYLRELVGV